MSRHVAALASSRIPNRRNCPAAGNPHQAATLPMPTAPRPLACANMMHCVLSRLMVQKGRMKSKWSTCGGMQSPCASEVAQVVVERLKLMDGVQQGIKPVHVRRDAGGTQSTRCGST